MPGYRRIAIWSVISVLLLALMSCTRQPYAHEIYFDLRDKPPDLLITPGLEQFVHSEPEGLRVTLPNDRNDLRHVAIGTRFGLEGDFDITATLEILSADQPAEGFGVGATLFINRVDRHYEGATLGRLLRSAGKDIVLWDNVLGKPGPERRFDARTKPCTDKRVRLRLKRVGNQLSYLLGPGLEGESFEELPEKQFGNDGIAQIALIATTGNQPVGVDVRWIDLRIRSHRVHGDAPSTMQIAETPRLFSRVWLVVALFGVFGVVLSLAAAKYLKRKRQHSDGKAVGFWTSTCSNCGKPLKARAELAGKNVKCPICGAIAKVAAQATEGRVADAPE